MIRPTSLLLLACAALAAPAAADDAQQAATRDFNATAALQNAGFYERAMQRWQEFLGRYPDDARRDRASQFAGVRTDLDLNEIEAPLMMYCQPAYDYLPHPQACLVTGITPQTAQQEGLPECEFIRRIHAAFSRPQTCVAGYNSIRFDDELTRQLLYRNFYDPYEREWKHGNSRWDIIDMLRLCHALRPEGLQWPQRDDGAVSFRLETLSAANGLLHENAHDALSDVRYHSPGPSGEAGATAPV